MSRLLFAACVVAASLAAMAQVAVDRDVIAKIKAEGLERSQVAPVFDTLTISIGPRLTASPAHKRAVDFVRDRLASYGLSNVHLEPWKFGRGWTPEKLVVEMIEPRYLPLIGYAEAWSASMPNEIVASPVWVGGKAPEALDAMRAQLKGAIVMTAPMMANFVRRDRPQPSDPGYVPRSAAYATSAGRAASPAPSASPAAGRGQGGGRGNAQQIAEILRGGRRRPSSSERWRTRHGVRRRT